MLSGWLLASLAMAAAVASTQATEDTALGVSYNTFHLSLGWGERQVQLGTSKNKSQVQRCAYTLGAILSKN